MDYRKLTNMIVKSIGKHAEEINRSGLSVDRDFLRDLTDELALEAARKGFNPVLVGFRNSADLAAAELEL